MTKYLKGECAHCAGHIEFPADAAGMTTACPHCGKQTDLLLATPEAPSGIPTRVLVWTGVTVGLLLVAFVVALWQLKRVERWAEAKKKAAAAQVPQPTPAPTRPPPVEDPLSKAQFRISEVKLEKDNGTSLIHAVGTIENVSAKPRFGVILEFEVLDADGKVIGSSKDTNPQAIEAYTKWTFHALVLQKNAATVRVKSLIEQQ